MYTCCFYLRPNGGGAAPRPRPTKALASRQLSAGSTRHVTSSREPRIAHSPSLETLRGPLTVPCESHFTFNYIVCCKAASAACRTVSTSKGCRSAGRCDSPRAGGTRNRREPCCFSRYVRIVARTTFVFVNNLYCIPAYVVWLLALRPVRPFFTSLYWKIEGLLFHWLLAMVASWTWTAHYEIVESGDEPATCRGRTLVLANHQSTADVPLLMTAWNARPGVLPNIMWIMDRLFKYTNFGIVSVLHQDFFIQAGRGKREVSLQTLRRHIHETYLPLGRQFMVLFPEGGFLHKRKPVSQRFAEKNNLPRLEYVSVPRAGAMKVIMEEVGPHTSRDAGPSTSYRSRDDNNQNNVKAVGENISRKSGDRIEWILDVTIAYEERVPLHLSDIVCGIRPPCTTHLHYRLFPSTEVPADGEEMTQWLYDRFIEKEALLEEYYRTGRFPARGPETQLVRQVRQDNLRFFIVHSFYLLSTILQVRMIWLLLSYLW